MWCWEEDIAHWSVYVPSLNLRLVIGWTFFYIGNLKNAAQFSNRSYSQLSSDRQSFQELPVFLSSTSVRKEMQMQLYHGIERLRFLLASTMILSVSFITCGPQPTMDSVIDVLRDVWKHKANATSVGNTFLCFILSIKKLKSCIFLPSQKQQFFENNAGRNCQSVKIKFHNSNQRLNIFKFKILKYLTHLKNTVNIKLKIKEIWYYFDTRKYHELPMVKALLIVIVCT